MAVDTREERAPTPARPSKVGRDAPQPKRRGGRVRTGRAPVAEEGTLRRRPDRTSATEPTTVAFRRRQSFRRPSNAVQRMPEPNVVQRDSESAMSGTDIDHIIRELEDRVLAEIERRGGRFAGSF